MMARERERGRSKQTEEEKCQHAYLLYLPLKYQRVTFGLFCHPDFNTKQLRGFVGQREDTVVPLRVTHPKAGPINLHTRRVRGSAVWEFCANADADET